MTRTGSFGSSTTTSFLGSATMELRSLLLVFLVAALTGYQLRWSQNLFKSTFSALQRRDEPETVQLNTPVIDVVSIGSMHRPGYQDAQQAIFTARRFFRVDERNDTEKDCQGLSWTQLERIVEHCHREPTNHTHLDRSRPMFCTIKDLKAKANAAGWMCAQKRLVDGLRLALQGDLPEYLVVVDDDTWIQWSVVVAHWIAEYPSHRAAVVPGCRLHFVDGKRDYDATFALGGFGTVLTRAALERLVRPLDCASPSADAWVQAACLRVEENQIGERSLFRPGMSVADLLFRYTFGQPFADVENWNEVGFCFHSDLILGYFVNYYGIADGIGVDRLGVYRDSEKSFRKKVHRRRGWDLKFSGECNHEYDAKCDENAHLCHYVTPEHMWELHRKQSHPR